MSTITSINNKTYYGGEGVTTAKYEDTAGLHTFVTPANNTNGIVLYFFSCFAITSGQGMSVSYGTSAPTNYRQGTLLCLSLAGSASFNYSHSENHAMPLYIPAGNGLYAMSSGSLTVGNVTVQYEVL